MPNSNTATLSRPASLSTISGALLNAHPGRRNACDCDMSDCNVHCADYTRTPRHLAATIAPSLGNDKGKADDGDNDDPHHDVTALWYQFVAAQRNTSPGGDDCYCNPNYGVKCGNCA